MGGVAVNAAAGSVVNIALHGLHVPPKKTPTMTHTEKRLEAVRMAATTRYKTVCADKSKPITQDGIYKFGQAAMKAYQKRHNLTDAQTGHKIHRG